MFTCQALCELIEDCTCIGSRPLIDVQVLKAKITEQEYMKRFTKSETGSVQKVELLHVFMDLYAIHVEKYLNTSIGLNKDVKFAKMLKSISQDKKSNPSGQYEDLSDTYLCLETVRLYHDTFVGSDRGYKFAKGVVLPGSLVELFEALTYPLDTTEGKFYKDFHLRPYIPRPTTPPVMKESLAENRRKKRKRLQSSSKKSKQPKKSPNKSNDDSDPEESSIEMNPENAEEKLDIFADLPETFTNLVSGIKESNDGIKLVDFLSDVFDNLQGCFDANTQL